MGVGYPLMAPLHLFLWVCSFIFILEKERRHLRRRGERAVGRGPPQGGSEQGGPRAQPGPRAAHKREEQRERGTISSRLPAEYGA